MTAVDDSALELRRLRWQCRRGLLELDLLFSRCLVERYPVLPQDLQDQFRSLLEQPDQSLLAWLQGQQSPPDELMPIINKLIQ